MKAFLWAVTAMVAISVTVGYVLISQEDAIPDSRVAESVQLR